MPKRKKKKQMPPSSYNTMPHYFPTGQVGIVKKIKVNRLRKKKRQKVICFILPLFTTFVLSVDCIIRFKF